MAPVTEAFALYGAGDPASKQLLACMRQAGLNVELRDTRKRDDEWRWTNLITLQKAGLTTIPQVFRPDGTLLGGYAETMAFLRSRKTRATPRTPQPA